MQAPDSYSAGQCSIGPIGSPAGGALSVISTKWACLVTDPERKELKYPEVILIQVETKGC